jgi:hypothetical protein
MMDNGKPTKDMEMESTSQGTNPNISASGIMIKSMEEASSFTLMELFSSDIGQMIDSMESLSSKTKVKEISRS